MRWVCTRMAKKRVPKKTRKQLKSALLALLLVEIKTVLSNATMPERRKMSLILVVEINTILWTATLTVPSITALLDGRVMGIILVVEIETFSWTTTLYDGSLLVVGSWRQIRIKVINWVRWQVQRFTC